jgi:hypothetical protein
VAGGYRRVHKGLHNSHALQNIIRVIKPRKMRLAGYVAHMGEMKSAHKILVKNLKGRDHLEDLGIDGKLILE